MPQLHPLERVWSLRIPVGHLQPPVLRHSRPNLAPLPQEEQNKIPPPKTLLSFYSKGFFLIRVINAVAAFGKKKNPHQKKPQLKTPRTVCVFLGFFSLFQADKEVYKCVLYIYVYVFLKIAFNKCLLHLQDPPTILTL